MAFIIMHLYHKCVFDCGQFAGIDLIPQCIFGIQL